jgi:hypothetical protein
MVSTRQTAAYRHDQPVVGASSVPVLIVWSLTLVALSWWPKPIRLPRNLPAVVEAFYTPRVMFLILAGLTLLVGWSARGDRERMWKVVGTSVALTVADFFLLQ